MSWSGYLTCVLNAVLAGGGVYAATGSVEAAVAAVLTNLVGLLQKQPHK